MAWAVNAAGKGDLQLGHAHSAMSLDADHRYAQLLLEPGQIQFDAPRFKHVEHIHRQDRRPAQFQHLG